MAAARRSFELIGVVRVMDWVIVLLANSSFDTGQKFHNTFNDDSGAGCPIGDCARSGVVGSLALDETTCPARARANPSLVVSGPDADPGHRDRAHLFRAE